MLTSWVRKWVPSRLRVIYKALQNIVILAKRFGQLQSMVKHESIDSTGSPIPWYTYPSIEYLKQLDFSQKKIFEYGSGNSTLFWSDRCRFLASVENDLTWFEKVKSRIAIEIDYHFFAIESDYVNVIHTYPHKFDVIIIDGVHRFQCAIEALKQLEEGGMIILDNADWHPKTSTLLREADLIQVDMPGFGPINGYTWTTSLFFSRSINLRSINQRQPVSSVGHIV